MSGQVFARSGDTNVVLRLRTNDQSGLTLKVTTSGTVVEPSGTPAPGVALWVSRGDALAVESKSDAAGKFEVSWSPAQSVEALIGARDLGRNLAAAASIDPLTTNIDLRLQEGLTLSGSVRDEKGAALKTATVRLFITGPWMSSQFIRQPAKVDEQGAFTISALPRGQNYGVYATAPGFVSASVRVEADQTQAASLQLQPIQLKPNSQP
jgi:hypothetical protein